MLCNNKVKGLPDETTNYLKALEQALKAGNATEHTYRPVLKVFVESLRTVAFV